MLVKELYYLCLIYEEMVLAHYIHHLLHEGKISLEDKAENINLNDASHDKVATLIENNELGFQTIGIYSLKRRRNQFAFIFAQNKGATIEYFMNIFHQRPLNCVKLLLDYEVIRGNEVTTFRELQKEFTEFPVLAGIFKRA